MRCKDRWASRFGAALAQAGATELAWGKAGLILLSFFLSGCPILLTAGRVGGPHMMSCGVAWSGAGPLDFAGVGCSVEGPQHQGTREPHCSTWSCKLVGTLPSSTPSRLRRGALALPAGVHRLQFYRRLLHAARSGFVTNLGLSSTSPRSRSVSLLEDVRRRPGRGKPLWKSYCEGVSIEDTQRRLCNTQKTCP